MINPYLSLISWKTPIPGERVVYQVTPELLEVGKGTEWVKRVGQAVLFPRF